jgi:group I intron endonuclease
MVMFMEIYNGTYCVYIHINKINGKKYVGQTICGDQPKRRWRNGTGYCNQSYFYSAIKKYGWDNFEHIILFNNISYDNACEIEQYLIKELQLQNIEYGYNIAPGGNANSMLGRHHTKETKEKISQKFRKVNGLKGENLLSKEENFRRKPGRTWP